VQHGVPLAVVNNQSMKRMNPSNEINTAPSLHTRRQWLKGLSGGFGYLAFSALAAEQGQESPLAPKRPHFSPRAKRIIFLCMRGGPSQMETFDYKPKLNADNLKPGRQAGLKLFGSQWKFNQHGQSGLWMSELFKHLPQHADRLCMIHSMHTDNENHPQALEQLHTGSFQFIRPSLGSWVAYGLGTENRNLPGFIALNPLSALGGNRYYSSAFLPASYQATSIGEATKSIKDARISHLSSTRLGMAGQRRQLDLLQSMNKQLAADQQNDGRIEGMIESYELAFRMQSEMPQVMDLAQESKSTLEMYGIGQGDTDGFGRQCLLARRFAEAGVRFIELTHTDWDHHGFVSTLMPRNCGQIDKPIAGLLTDLGQRGLLEDTLLMWGGEFGRTPDDPTQDGRGHNHKGYTMWLAGGGTKGGHVHGATDEHGYEAVTDKVHTHDLHATLLHLLGLDHERLTYRHGGRDFRLTDVKGDVVQGLLA